MDWLANHTNREPTFISDNIVRCHRGPNPKPNPTTGVVNPPSIECRFTSKLADEVYSALGKETTDGVRIR